MSNYSLAEAKNKLLTQFKAVKTYEDFVVFEKELLCHNLLLRSKGRKLRAFSFHHMYRGQHLIEFENECDTRFNNIKYKDRVTYLFDDGVSKGESYVRNLHRNLEIYG